MNWNLCRHKCGKVWNPSAIIRAMDGNWYLLMDDQIGSFSNECSCLQIEPPQEFLDNHPPRGWLRNNAEGRHSQAVRYDYAFGDVEDVMWKVRLVATQSSCPYVAEHIMYDLQHENKISLWRAKEKKRLARVMERLEKTQIDKDC